MKKKFSYYTESKQLEMKIAREARYAKRLLIALFVILAADIVWIFITSLHLKGEI